MKVRAAMAGFSLVEALVALAILSGVLIATYSTLSTALAVALRVATRREAVEAITQRLSEARLRGIRSPLAAQGTTSSYRWSLVISVLPTADEAGAGGVIPYQAIGSITARAGKGAPEIVLDTILLGRGT